MLHFTEPNQSNAADLTKSAAVAADMSPTVATGLTHLYRAEVGRLTAYRRRIDTTTTWAITTAGLVTTFSLGNASISHAAFLFLMVLLLFFLTLESRRFRSYEASRIRVSLLESSFFPQLLDRGTDPRWLDTLVGMLQRPTPTVTIRQSIAWRLRVNYLWLFAAVILFWLVKLDLTRGSIGPFDLVYQAGVGSVPGWFVLSIVLLGFSLLIILALATGVAVPGVDNQIDFLVAQDRD